MKCDIAQFIPFYIYLIPINMSKLSQFTILGHGHSMSAQRYLFDLDLLEKDVIRYGHDPHTHYYLGVTHEAYADKLFDANPVLTDEVVHHINASIHYLSLRASSTYRWVKESNCMRVLSESITESSLHT